jgi:hypothetical protein
MAPVPLRFRSGPPRGRAQLAPPEVDGTLLRCYTCGGVAVVGAADPFDPLADRSQWPAIECPIAPGCTGCLVPEALN